MSAFTEIVSEPPFQLGYVLPEIGDADSYMHALGVGAFERFDDAPIHSEIYRGQPVSPRQNLVLGFRQELNIELIEVIEGPSIYTDFLDSRPMGGLHHVGWRVADLGRAAAVMSAAGYEPVQTGRFGDGGGHLYFDTRVRLGHHTKLLHLDPVTEALFARVRDRA